MPSRKVAIFVDMEAAYGRGVMYGISRYIRAHSPWTIYGDPQRIVAPVPDLQHWPGDGVITQAWNDRNYAQIRDLHVPVVNVSHHIERPGVPSVLADSRQIGQIAAKHLLERGFRHFAFCGYVGHRYSEIRAESFRDAVLAAGGSFDQFDTEPPQVHPDQWEPQQTQLGEWLSKLPRPVGVLACNDSRAGQVSQVCSNFSLRIPEDVSLVGVDNDILVCEMSNPPLSSIDVSAEQVGYQAAALLDRLMKGEPAPEAPVLVPPRSVVVRRSSESLAISDPAVAEAMRYIHDHANTDLSVEDVVNAVPLSRRVLERRFRTILNTTIYDAVASARIDRVKQSLMHDDAPTPQIAHRCGFRYVQQFNRMFKQLTGMTPTAFRRQFRSGVV